MQESARVREEAACQSKDQIKQRIEMIEKQGEKRKKTDGILVKSGVAKTSRNESKQLTILPQE